MIEMEILMHVASIQFVVSLTKLSYQYLVNVFNIVLLCRLADYDFLVSLTPYMF